jgi:hypothetical protein
MINKNFLGIVIFIFLVSMLTNPALAKKGTIEFGFHYGSWSLNLLKGLFEENMQESFDTSIKDALLEEIQIDHPELVERSFTQTIDFGSSGNNYGFEIRWYPGGEGGSFSLGLSLEKSTMRFGLENTGATLELVDQFTLEPASFNGEVKKAEFEINPTTFLLSFRWDLKPSWRVSPYITLGIGAGAGTAFEVATITYDYEGTLFIPGESPEIYSGEDVKNLEEIREEADDPEDIWIPSVFPFIQLNLGLKGEIVEGLYALADFGIWDGFLFRGGLAYRF